jgi:molybdopterin-containing oxidoreductase family membrane subunit
MSWFGGENVEGFLYFNRLIGVAQYAPVTWAIVFCNVLAPQVLWFRRVRRSEVMLLIVSVIVLAGMWMERYMIIASSLSRDYLPSSWGIFRPTIWDILTYIGSLGVFIAAFLLFCRFLPIISMSELRAMLPGAHGREEGT